MRNRARHFNPVGRLIPSVVAMPLFEAPSPAISKALARVTTRYGAVALGGSPGPPLSGQGRTTTAFSLSAILRICRTAS